jgi:nucleoside-diphosphate-sugar epimerase
MNISDEQRSTAGLSILWPNTDNQHFKEALAACDAGESYNNTSAVVRYQLQNGASFMWLEAGVKYHAVAEEGVPMRDIAEAIGRGLNTPVKSISAEEAPAHFGWLAMFADHDLLASSEMTRKQLGWTPTGPGLIADLERLGVSER